MSNGINAMLTIPGNARIFLYQQPMNMRKSFEGLGAEVEKLFPKELLSGAFFVFLNRGRDHMKVLFWDGDGFVIWYKRLEKGSFGKWGTETTLNRTSFLMMLEGVIPKKITARFSL